MPGEAVASAPIRLPGHQAEFMKLTQDQYDKLTKFVEQKWQKPYQCPYCRSNNWNITHEVYQLTEFSGGNLVLGGPVVPLAPVTCNNCGHTVLLNALVAGVVDQKKEEVKKDAD
jgi:hypothetical protein